MTTPVPDADAVEQQLTAEGEPAGNAVAHVEMPDDAPEADAVEQAQPAAPGEVRADVGERPLEADVADVAEQDVAVPLDEDEGRE